MEEIKKEFTGIYNTTFNQKNATPIQTQFEKDIEAIENAIIEEVVMYVRGFHNIKRDKGFGAEHIKLHLEPNSDGYISVEELLNLGKSIREYTSIFKEPFIDVEGSKQAKVYEWENDKGVRFRTIVDKIRREGDNCPSTSSDGIKREGLPKTPLSPSDNVIITFYSDRNLNTRMEFKNLKVAQYYGLCHILKRRTEQIGEEKALKFISHLAENIKNGVMIEAKYNRIGIITNKTTIILEQTEDNQFILTAYIDKKNTLKLENLQSVHDVNFIDESISTLNKGFDVLSPNQSQEPIIPQNPKPIHSSQFKVQKLSKINKSTDKAIIPTKQRKR